MLSLSCCHFSLWFGVGTSHTLVGKPFLDLFYCNVSVLREYLGR